MVFQDSAHSVSPSFYSALLTQKKTKDLAKLGNTAVSHLHSTMSFRRRMWLNAGLRSRFSNPEIKTSWKTSNGWAREKAEIGQQRRVPEFLSTSRDRFVLIGSWITFSEYFSVTGVWNGGGENETHASCLSPTTACAGNKSGKRKETHPGYVRSHSRDSSYAKRLRNTRKYLLNLATSTSPTLPHKRNPRNSVLLLMLSSPKSRSDFYPISPSVCTDLTLDAVSSRVVTGQRTLRKVPLNKMDPKGPSASQKVEINDG